MDIEKHITFWRIGAEEDIQVAEELMDKKRFRQALFFAHLAVEKAIKAHIARETRNIPPRIHNLLRLAEITSVTLSNDDKDFFARLNIYQIHGRYPEEYSFNLDEKKSQILLSRAKEVVKWLIEQLLLL